MAHQAAHKTTHSPTIRVVRLMRDEMPCHLPNCLDSALILSAVGFGGTRANVRQRAATRVTALLGKGFGLVWWRGKWGED